MCSIITHPAFTGSGWSKRASLVHPLRSCCVLEPVAQFLPFENKQSPTLNTSASLYGRDVEEVECINHAE